MVNIIQLRGAPRRRSGRNRRSRLDYPWLTMALIAFVAGTALATNRNILDVASRTGQTPSGQGGERAETALHSANFVLCSSAHRQGNCVVDGDTVRINGVTIRLADIDTPETHEPRCASEAARGAEATSRLLSLMNEGPVVLARTGKRDEDRYGRKLRTIERHGRSLGAILVAEGLARPWEGRRRGWCG